MSHIGLILLECTFPNALLTLSVLRDDPYDQVIFPPDSNVAEGRPNSCSYDFSAGAENVIGSLVERTDPSNEKLRKKCRIWMELTKVVNEGFTALGWTRILPRVFRIFLCEKVNVLYKLASYSVRDVQYAIFNKGRSVYTRAQFCMP